MNNCIASSGNSRGECQNIILEFCISAFSILLIFPLVSSLANFSDSQKITILCWMTIILFVDSIVFLWRTTKRLFSSYTLLSVSFFLYQFGADVANVFWPNEETFINNIYYVKMSGGNAGVFNSILISSVFYFFFTLGQLSYFYHPFHYRIPRKIKESKMFVFENTQKVIFVSSLVLFFVSFPLGFYKALYQFLYVKKYGYLSLVNNKIFYNLAGNFEVFIVPTLLLICLFGKKTWVKVICFILSLSYLLLTAGSGSRTTIVSFACIVLVFCFRYLSKAKLKTKLWFIPTMLVVLYFGVCFIAAYAKYRNSADQSLSGFVSFFFSFSLSQDPLAKVVSEFGFNASSLPFSIELIGSKYYFGKSYFCALFGLIPSSLDFTGFFTKLANYSATDTALLQATATYLNFGPGTSMIAEAFLNFRWLGIFPMFIFGYWFTSLSCFDFCDKTNRFEFYIQAVMSGTIFIMPRRPFLYLVKGGLYSCLLIFVYLFFCFVLTFFIKRFIDRRRRSSLSDGN